MIVKKVDDLIMCEYLYNVTTRCNCRCKHCNPKVYTGKDHELSSREMIEQYEKSRFLQGNTINIAGGEPFVKADLEEFVLYLDKHKIPCVIATNGWFTEKIIHLADQLEDNKTVRFAISIDGTKDIHDDIRRCSGIYERAVASVKALKERCFNVQVNTVIQKENLSSLCELDRVFKDMGVPVAYIPEIFVSEEEFNFTPDDIREAFQYVTYPRGRKYLLSKGKYLITGCHAGTNSWYVDSNGDVYACWGCYYRDDSDRYILGNLFEQDFDTIFTSDRKKQVCEEIVRNCSGCLLPRDLEREADIFGMDTSYTKEEVAVLGDDLENVSRLDDFSVDESEWHLLEKDSDGRTFRWMKKQEARIFLNLKGKSADRLNMDLLNICPPREGEDPLKLEVMLDKEWLGEAACEPGNSRISLEISKDVPASGLVEVELKINRLWSPNDYTGSEDTRKLGIGIYQAEIV